MILMAYMSYMLAEVWFPHISLPWLFSVLPNTTGSLSNTDDGVKNVNLSVQLFYLSGILTVFFCGIVMSHYTWHNVTESSRVTTKYVDHLSFNSVELVCIHYYKTNCSLAKTQAHFCNFVIRCWDFYIPLCWHGCLGHWEMERCQW